MKAILIRFPILLLLVPFASACFLGVPVFILCSAGAAIKTAFDSSFDPRSTTLCAAVVLMSAAGCLLAPDPSHPDPPRLVHLEGVIKDGPWRSRSRAGVFLLRIETDRQTFSRKSAGSFRVEFKGGYRLDLAPGTMVSFPAEAVPSRGGWRFRTAASLICIEGEAALAVLKSRIYDLRQRLRQSLDRTLSRETAGLAVSVLLGLPESVNRETRETFRKSGTLHLLAISGLHVGIVLYSLSRLLSMIALPERIGVAVQIAALVALCLVAGSRIPVIRASLIGCLFLLGTTCGRTTASTNYLFIALFLILLLDPLAPRDLSFQLSFAGYASILAYLKCRFTCSGYHGKILQAAGLSFSAWLGTAPLVAWHFGQIVPLAPLVNLLAIPLFSVVLTSGVVHLLLSNLFPFFGGCSAWIAETMFQLLLQGLSTLCQILPEPWIVPRPPGFLLFVFYGTIALALLAQGRRKKHKLMLR